MRSHKILKFLIALSYFISLPDLLAQSCSNLSCAISAVEEVEIACCGDNQLNGSEECDGDVFTDKPASITPEIWDQKQCGAPGTEKACRIILPDLKKCGDGVINQDWEECDGSAVADVVGVPTNTSTEARRCNAPGTPQECRFSYDCQYYKADFYYELVNKEYRKGEVSDEYIISGDHAKLSCLEEVLTNLDYSHRIGNGMVGWKVTHKEGYQGNQLQSYKDFYDDAMLLGLIKYFTDWDSEDLFNMYMVLCNGNVFCTGMNVVDKKIPTLNNLFFDLNCKPMTLQNLNQDQICGNIKIKARISPISLDFGDLAKWGIVQFKLFPGQKDTDWVVWKGGSTRPLLVFTEDHERKISDGRQLFGNWFNGGKEFQNISLNSNSGQQLWENGYEALSSLDQDADGFLTEAELANIALWFDHNQNAQVDPGEIKKLYEVGIVKLNVNFDYTDPKSGDHISTVGYELSDGRTGASVDWFSGVYASQAEAVMELDKLDTLDSKLAMPDLKALNNKGDNLTGIWFWKADNDSKTFGVLGLKDVEGQVSGNSVFEEALEKNKDNLKSHLVKVPLKGNRFKQGSQTALKFRLEQDDIATETDAVYNSAAKLLKGSSKYVKAGKEISYQWTAKRLGQ